MKLLYFSKDFLWATNRAKIEILAKKYGLDILIVTFSHWGEKKLEPLTVSPPYRFTVLPIVFSGHFHLYFLQGLGKVIQDFHPDLIHFEEEAYNLATFQTCFLAKKYYTPFIFTSWQTIKKNYPPPFSFFEKFVYQNSAAAQAVTKSAENVLKSKGFRKPIATFPSYGVDLTYFFPDPPNHPNHPKKFAIGFAGRNVPEKGLDTLKKAVTSLDFPSDLKILSGQPSTSAPGFLRSLDLLVVPSVTTKSWEEQFGRVLVEALSCGVPVIGSDSGEIPHILQDCGLTFHQKNPRDLAKKIIRLHKNPHLLKTLSGNGQKKVRQFFCAQKIAQRTHTFYRTITKH